jgi:hypothetical protein
MSESETQRTPGFHFAHAEGGSSAHSRLIPSLARGRPHRLAHRTYRLGQPHALRNAVVYRLSIRLSRSDLLRHLQPA